jgi:hypothetical protein
VVVFGFSQSQFKALGSRMREERLRRKRDAGLPVEQQIWKSFMSPPLLVQGGFLA